ncbi:MAG: ZIP family metal transporter [Gemmatimonadota bacterium]|jgi:ZIP family zinc transporter|nr:ZIP family metal transporter [Gemmatimonadota bacterium]MDP6528364.1 ZIP family metal transporter [Gemmatimonadota bacterium]MDP6802820.1 ZIP family metal transporter [Gemmatimonadota bacterium]MDP7031033.1 ZIP family metal transporter [Gemmatimonadota bacterium]
MDALSAVGSAGEMGFVLRGFVAGLLASLACGLGAIPVAFRGLRLEERIGLAYAFAGGLMFAAAFYNLLMPALTMGGDSASRLLPVAKTLAGMGLGAAFLWAVDGWLTPDRLASSVFRSVGGRQGTLIFLAMAFHSIPEGIAVGVGYGSEAHVGCDGGLGTYIAIAIGIHNIPEGLAVALPLRLGGASLGRCFLLAFLTSLPQPIAAVPAAWLVWLAEPLMLPLLGFAAGAMIYLVLLELIPDALKRHDPPEIAWSFLAGFGLMVLVQVAL